MALIDEISVARSQIHRDGYDMSFGELISLYQNNELVIAPQFQRLFRWSETQKTRFIESVLLNIPIPPIFVFTREDGVWELVDGLQRLSTILQLTGVLQDDNGNVMEPFVCEGTRTLPSLGSMRWGNDDEEDEARDVLPNALQISIKRSRIRVEILGQETDPRAKFELFQRLNTGGANLSEQEVRTCIIVSIDPDFHEWIGELAGNQDFLDCLPLTERQLSRQFEKELVVRFLVYRNIEYANRLDVHDYLDEGIMDLSQDRALDLARERSIFEEMFALINRTLGNQAFRRFGGGQFAGPFSLGAYECVVYGLSRALEENHNNVNEDFVRARIQGMWQHQAFRDSTGAGVRGTTRLTNLVFAHGRAFFAQ